MKFCFFRPRIQFSSFIIVGTQLWTMDDVDPVVQFKQESEKQTFFHFPFLFFFRFFHRNEMSRTVEWNENFCREIKVSSLFLDQNNENFFSFLN